MSVTGGKPQVGDATDDLVAVRLLSLSLSDLHESEAHHDELFREFALVAGSDPEGGYEVPVRLLALIEELRSDFAGFAAGPQAEMAAATARGETEVDVTFLVPPQVGEAAVRLAQLLTEADDYCRNGALLTLASPPPTVAFRNWYLGEFVAQINGADPTPWPEYRARALSAS